MGSNDTGSSFTTTPSSFIYIIVNVPNFKCSYQSKFLQLNFLKRFLGGGFIKHMQVCFLLLMVLFHLLLCHILDFLVVYCQINCSSEWSWEIFLKWWKQENEFLQDVFGFTPKKKHLLDDEYRISSTDKVGSYQFLLAACTSLHCVIFGGISIILSGYLFHIVYVPFCLYIYSFFFSLSFEQRMYKSPNSVVSKARTQQLNKQRMLSEVGLFLMKDFSWLG